VKPKFHCLTQNNSNCRLLSLAIWIQFKYSSGTEYWTKTYLEKISLINFAILFLIINNITHSPVGYATSRKVVGSIPDYVIGIFHWHNSCGRTMTLGLIQPLTEISTRNISLGGGCKGSRCVGLTNLPPSCAECLEIWEPQTSGTLLACPGL